MALFDPLTTIAAAIPTGPVAGASAAALAAFPAVGTPATVGLRAALLSPFSTRTPVAPLGAVAAPAPGALLAAGRRLAPRGLLGRRLAGTRLAGRLRAFWFRVSVGG